MPGAAVMLICRCADAGVVPDAARQAVLDEARRRGVACVEVDDLCGLAADRDAALTALAAPGRTVVVAACHDRAVRGLLRAAGVLPADLRVLDLRANGIPALLAQLPAAGTPAAPAVPPAARADAWTPWFPVIDADRCRQCRQCLSFCLFGVYAAEPDGRVTVANPRACKNRCPACARICPDVAIIFPKLPEAEAPLNGAAVTREHEAKDRARASIQEVLGDDVYAALARRRQAQRPNRQLLKTPLARAEAERAACAAAAAKKAASPPG